MVKIFWWQVKQNTNIGNVCGGSERDKGHGAKADDGTEIRGYIENYWSAKLLDDNPPSSHRRHG